LQEKKTVLSNHCFDFIANNSSRAGIIHNNPVHKDMLYAAEAIKLQFILNVVIDRDKKITASYSGDFSKAHEKGCQHIIENFAFQSAEADLVITTNGGYPLDQNIYQSVKGLSSAEVCVKNGGVIIIAASCCDGHGGEEFYKIVSNNKTPIDIWNNLSRITSDCTMKDQWQAQILARVLMKAKVIFITELQNKTYIENMHMIYARDFQEALTISESILGNKREIVLIPDGTSVIINKA